MRKILCVLILIVNLLIIGCSSKPDISGKWKGITSLSEAGKTYMVQFSLLLSQNEKNIKGTITVGLQGGGEQNTFECNGFIEGKEMFLEYENLILGKTKIQGTVESNKILCKFSLPGMGDLQLDRVD